MSRIPGAVVLLGALLSASLGCAPEPREIDVEFSRAVAGKDFERARVALRAGADVNAVADDRMTSLHFAAATGHPEIVQFLVDEGAKLDLGNSRCETALMLASSMGHLDAVRVLVEYAFRYRNMRKVWLRVWGNNERGIHAYLAAGFLEEGRLRCHVWSAGEYVDLVSAGVIDPAMVTRSALQNAASIAKNILTTEAIVAEVPEKDGGPAGGGMPDMSGMM